MSRQIEVARVSDRTRKARNDGTRPTSAPVCWHRDDRLAVRCVGPDSAPDDFEGVECVVVETGPPAVDSLDVLWTIRRVAAVPVFVVPFEADRNEGLAFENGSVTRLDDSPMGRSTDGTGDMADEIVAAVDRSRADRRPRDESESSDGLDDGDVPPRRYAAKIRSLHEVAVHLVSCDTEPDVFERAVDAAAELLDLDHTAVHLPENGKLVPVAISERLTPDHEPATIDVDHGATGRAFQTGKSIIVDDTVDDDLAEPTHPAIRSLIAVPFGLVGILVAIDDTRGAFDETDRTLAELLAAHVRTAIERIRSSNRTRQERDRFLALFENVPDPVAICERDDGTVWITRVNAAFERTFGVDRASVRGDRLDDHVRPPAATGDGTAFGTDRSVVVREIRARTADGVRDFLLGAFGVEADDRQRYVILTDITERKRDKRQLEEKTERLEQFAGIVSHDLRNPLEVAKEWAGHAREHATDPETIETIEKIDSALYRMDALIDDLLSLARTGWAVDQQESVQGDDLATTAWNNVATRDATLVTEWDDAVAVDPNTAVELFENLFRNSVEHGSTGSQTQSDDAVNHATGLVTVTVGSLSDAEGFYVADDGPGIDPEISDSAFEMGVTGDEDGTGIGLAIVKRIADAHGWSVRLTESTDGGARFEFRFEGSDQRTTRNE